MKFFALAALPILAFSLNASAVTPLRYNMNNGDGNAAGGSFNYWDDTYTGAGNKTLDGAALSGGLGQLTDSILGGSIWYLDQGNGNAQEWVGWNTTTPKITFDFGSAITLSKISLHSDNSKYGGVGLFGAAHISTSSDGVTFTPFSDYFTPGTELANTANRFVDVPVGTTSRYFQVTLDDQDANLPWVFVSEITFDGTATASPVPEVSPALGAFALTTLAGACRLLRRKR